MSIINANFELLKIGIIGLGNVGSALGNGLRLAQHQNKTIGCDRNLEKRNAFTQATAIATTENWKEVVAFSDLILVCIRHSQVLPFLEELRDTVDADKAIVSLAAAVSCASLKESLSPARLPIIRAITNVNIASRRGLTMILSDSDAVDANSNVVDLFQALGDVIVTDSESELDRASVLSGCGPAATAIFLEALCEFGIRTGLPELVAKEIALQCAAASINTVQQTGSDLETFKYSVAAPGGIVDKLLGGSGSAQINDAVVQWFDHILGKIEGRA